jgi:hypothetical protein
MPQANASHPQPRELGDATIAALAAAIGAGATGPGTAADAQRVTLASDGPGVAALGAPADVEAAGNGSITAILKRVRTLLGETLAVTDGGVDNVVTSATATALNQGETLSMAGYQSITFQVVSNPSGSSIAVEGSNDGGTTWTAIQCRRAEIIPNVTGAVALVGTTAQTILIPAYVAAQMRWRSSLHNGNVTVATCRKRGQAVGALDTFVANTVAVTPITGTYYNEAVVATLAGFTSTGTARDLGVAAGGSVFRNYFNAFAVADQAGTLRIEGSDDNSTWRRMTLDIAVAANTPIILSVPVFTRYQRGVFVNGGTNQTFFMFKTSHGTA